MAYRDGEVDSSWQELSCSGSRRPVDPNNACRTYTASACHGVSKKEVHGGRQPAPHEADQLAITYLILAMSSSAAWRPSGAVRSAGSDCSIVWRLMIISFFPIRRLTRMMQIGGPWVNTHGVEMAYGMCKDCLESQMRRSGQRGI